jgi:ankyrin repeat protein
MVLVAGITLLGALRWRVGRTSLQERNRGAQDGEFQGAADSPNAPQPRDVFVDPLTVALAEAAIRGDGATIQALKSKGAKINQPGREGLTPLHIALLHFNFAGFRALLENGADTNTPADNGVAVMSLVAVMPDAKWLEAALRYGGQVERRDEREQTPLMLAASRAQEQNVKMLIAHGADVNAKDRHGDGPLTHALHALQRSAAIAQILIKHGANFNEPDDAGFTPRDYAGTHHDPSLMAVFVEAQ